MPTARRLGDSRGAPVGADEALLMRKRALDAGEPRPGFRCLKCDARVHPVTNNRTETKRGGAPFFARNRSPETGPPNAHAPTCTFAFSHRVRELLESSEGALTRATEAGNPVYRLSLPHTFEQAQHLTAGGHGPLIADLDFVRRTTVVLNTAIKVTQMLAEFQSVGAVIEADFRATCDGQDIPWLDFMYTRGRLITLARRIEQNGPLIHPAAAVVNASSKPRQGRAGAWYVLAGLPRPDGDDGQRNIFISAPDPSWLPTPSSRGDVLYGMWSVAPPRPGYEGSLTISLPDRSCVSPMPEGISSSTVDVWNSRQDELNRAEVARATE